MYKKFFMICAVLLVSACSFSHNERHDLVDMVVFSYNRPMQLYALLESVKKYVTGVHDITVIYRASDAHYEAAYKKVKHDFERVKFVQQSHTTARQDFKKQVLEATFKGSVAYVMFAVDDDIVTDYVHLTDCVRALKRTGAYAFYLRLGLHVTECYSERSYQGIPSSLQEVEPGIYQWQFKDGRGDWRYPHSVDMTIFNKKMIKEALMSLSYTTPNTLEGQWAAWADVQKRGLCYAHTKMINIPLNLVQTDWVINRNSQLFTPAQLLEKFQEGLKIDIQPLYKFHNESAHSEYVPTFVQR